MIVIDGGGDDGDGSDDNIGDGSDDNIGDDSGGDIYGDIHDGSDGIMEAWWCDSNNGNIL